MSEPLIAVKKADGTIVRLPLSEIKKMKEGNAKLPVPPKPEFKIPVPEDALVSGGGIPVFSNNNDPLAAVKKLLSVPEIMPAPVEPLIPEKFSDSVVAVGNPMTTSKPHDPLLFQEPTVQEIKHEASLGTASYDAVVTRVLAEAKLTPPESLASRYQSLIMSAAKGIRTIEQVIRYATMPGNQGGLGLDAGSALRLQEALKHIPGIQVPIAPLKRSLPTAVRPVMRDVEPPSTKNISIAPTAAAVMGPVEEMKNFSLLDWRRLAATPEKAAEIVMRKFAGWKQESFYLYQDTRAAWLVSPLVRDYQKTLAEAINQNTHLSSLTGGGNVQNTITAYDITALVAVNHSLAV